MYRNFYLALCALLFPVLLHAQGIKFFEGTWEEALHKSESEGLPIFLDAYASWCGPCKYMASNVFTKERAGEYFNSHFINMQIDMEKGIGPELARKYHVRAYPTLLFISADGEIIQSAVGAMDVNELLKLGALAFSKYDENSVYRIAYEEEGKRDYETVYGYLLSLRKSNKSTVKVANDYLHSEPELSKEQRINFVFAAASEADSRLFDEAIKYKNALIKQNGRDKYEEWMMEAVFNTVKKAVKFQYKPLMTDAVQKISKFAGSNADLYKAQAEMLYYALVNDNAAYLKAAQAYHNSLQNPSLKKNLKLAQDMLNNFNNEKTRDLAMEFIQESWNGSQDAQTLIDAAQFCVQCYSFKLASAILVHAGQIDEKVKNEPQFKALHRKIENSQG